jgi:hypothetical protein
MRKTISWISLAHIFTIVHIPHFIWSYSNVSLTMLRPRSEDYFLALIYDIL